jgi:hypothetical protein
MKTTATKKPAKLAPITIQGRPVDLAYRSTFTHLLGLPTSKLKELLRERAVPIPKTKNEMARRLAAWCHREGGTFTLELR